MVNLMDFLKDKEERVEYQKKLIEKYGLPLLTIRTNIPGEDKNIILANNITEELSKELDLIFEKKIVFKERFENLEGLFYIFIIKEEVYEIKNKTIVFEETNELGRCVDIDVYKTDGKSITRKELGFSQRKCFICENSAHSCVRSMKHSFYELYNFLEEKYRNYLSHKLAMKAVESAIYELSTSPSFGLVSPITSGSHKDMNFYSFIASSFSIEKGFYETARIGYSNLEISKAFLLSREIGKRSEKAMMKSTGNVNTHKGFIFLMGILILAVSRSYYLGEGIEKVPHIVKEISKNILNDFVGIEKKEKLTNGEKLYLKYGFKGIRGEVENGLSKVFKFILPFYFEKIKKFDCNLASSMTLIYIMSMLEDSTIVHRHGIEMLEKVKKETESLINVSDLKILEEYEDKCIKNRVSPGGSADILAVTIFLYKVYY